MKKELVLRVYLRVFLAALTVGPLLGILYKERMHMLAADTYEFYETVRESEFFKQGRYL